MALENQVNLEDLEEEDLIREEVIQSIRTYYYLDVAKIEKKYQINFFEYFNPALQLSGMLASQLSDPPG